MEGDVSQTWGQRNTLSQLKIPEGQPKESAQKTRFLLIIKTTSEIG